jgi:predicted Fe-S protein YdhL (DUF1289 family)
LRYCVATCVACITDTRTVCQGWSRNKEEKVSKRMAVAPARLAGKTEPRDRDTASERRLWLRNPEKKRRTLLNSGRGWR